MGCVHAYEDIISYENLLSAWDEFLVGKRYRKDVQEFSRTLASNVHSLHAELKEGTYRHSGYVSFKVNDPKPRDIHKASVRDRLLHHALYRVLYPLFDKSFVHDSYSCRKGKGTHAALRRFAEFSRKCSRNGTRQCWVLKCDVRKFFASIDHPVLMEILKRKISDAGTLFLLQNIIGSFETHGRPGVGLPLGNLTSQLLVNVYMDRFDQFVKRKLQIKYYVRYADDFVVFANDGEALGELLSVFANFLRIELKLELHPDKCFVKTLHSGVDFLGWIHFSDHRTLRAATRKRMFRRLDGNPSKEAVASYRGMLGHGNARGLEKTLAMLINPDGSPRSRG